MYLTDLALSDFRSYRQVIIKLDRGVITFVGDGQGKTNIVEAIGYLATLSSHRVSSPRPRAAGGHRPAWCRRAGNARGGIRPPSRWRSLQAAPTVRSTAAK